MFIILKGMFLQCWGSTLRLARYQESTLLLNCSLSYNIHCNLNPIILRMKVNYKKENNPSTQENEAYEGLYSSLSYSERELC